MRRLSRARVCQTAAGDLERQSFYEILVLHDTDLAVLQVAGADVGGLAEDARKRIVLALLADLRT